MKRPLLIPLFALIGWVAGCKTQAPTSQIAPIAGNGFALDWPAHLNTAADPIRGVYVRGDRILAFTAKDRGFWLTTGGKVLAVNQVAEPGNTLHAPVALADGLVVPTTGSLEAFSRDGRLLTSFTTPSAIQSAAAGTGSVLFLGVSNPNGGRLARYDLTTAVTQTWELFTGRGLIAAPATFRDEVFAGGVDGRVWAVTVDRGALWSTPDNVFKTDGQISANLSVDDFGVYVASQDQKLYCLDRASGKIKWAYYAPAALTDQPIVVGDVVYQLIPGRGLAAINKKEGPLAREAKWVQKLARQILSFDEKNLYVADADHNIVALSRETGEVLFQSQQKNLTIFATNLETPIIYAGTSDGDLLSIRPVTKPGMVGQLVSAPLPRTEMLASGN